MEIKLFRHAHVRVPDPLRPGRFAQEERLHATGATELSHDGETYKADKSGWFNVPHEAGMALVAFRHPNGERFHTPDEVHEQERLGVAPIEAPEVKAEKKADDKADEKAEKKAK